MWVNQQKRRRRKPASRQRRLDFFCITRCCLVCSASPTRWQKTVSADPLFRHIRASMIWCQALVTEPRSKQKLFRKSWAQINGIKLQYICFPHFPRCKLKRTYRLNDPDYVGVFSCRSHTVKSGVMSPNAVLSVFNFVPWFHLNAIKKPSCSSQIPKLWGKIWLLKSRCQHFISTELMDTWFSWRLKWISHYFG